MGLNSAFGITVGRLPKGPRNLISDVAGVTVGHCTLAQGEVQTGVTALLPHQGDVYHDKVAAAAQVINGFGKSVGLVQIAELGTLETPILLTNTLSVGAASDGLVRYMLARCEDICTTTASVNPVVCECNDAWLNDIRGLHITAAHVQAALRDQRADFAEGAVGAGRGMRCHGLKGGIGSASRRFALCGATYTLGALVLTNHARFEDLTINGRAVAPLLAGQPTPAPHEDKGSVIVILATDLPLTARQLGRLCRRAIVGLSRTGSQCGNGSGEIALAFTTANRLPHYARAPIPLAMLPDDLLDTPFCAVAEAVEEAVLSSLLHAQTVTGRAGHTLYALPQLLKAAGTALA